RYNCYPAFASMASRNSNHRCPSKNDLRDCASAAGVGRTSTSSREQPEVRLLLESENAPSFSGAFSSVSQSNVWKMQSDFGRRYYPVAARYPALAAFVMA